MPLGRRRQRPPCSPGRTRLSALQAVLVLGALFTVAGASVDSTADPTAAAAGLLEKVLVERVVWPVRLKPLAPGGCEDLDPSQIMVREDGAVAAVTQVERRDLKTLHALLIVARRCERL